MPEGKAQEPKVYFEVPFLYGEGKESGGPKGHRDRGLGICGAESRAENPTMQQGVRAKIIPELVPPHEFYSPLPASAEGYRHVF